MFSARLGRDIKEMLESLRCDDSDGNENVNKAIRLDQQNINSARAAHFSVHFFAVTALHDYDVKFPRATIYRGRKHKPTKFSFRLKLGFVPQEFSSSNIYLHLVF